MVLLNAGLCTSMIAFSHMFRKTRIKERLGEHKIHGLRSVYGVISRFVPVRFHS